MAHAFRVEAVEKNCQARISAAEKAFATFKTQLETRIQGRMAAADQEIAAAQEAALAAQQAADMRCGFRLCRRLRPRSPFSRAAQQGGVLQPA